MILTLLFFTAVRADEEENDDFWNQIENDEVTVEEKTQGTLYDKARFDVPISRRLKLYPDVFVIVKRLQDHSRIEFVYEAKVPKLYFLDSQDVTVESFDLSKMSQDEIMSILNLRGFALVSEETSESKKNIPTEIGDNRSNNTAFDTNSTIDQQNETNDEPVINKEEKERKEAAGEAQEDTHLENDINPDSRMFSETIQEEPTVASETPSVDL